MRTRNCSQLKSFRHEICFIGLIGRTGYPWLLRYGKRPLLLSRLCCFEMIKWRKCHVQHIVTTKQCPPVTPANWSVPGPKFLLPDFLAELGIFGTTSAGTVVLDCANVCTQVEGTRDTNIILNTLCKPKKGKIRKSRDAESVFARIDSIVSQIWGCKQYLPPTFAQRKYFHECVLANRRSISKLTIHVWTSGP